MVLEIFVMLKLIHSIEPYYIFLLAIIGFFGNSLSIFLFSYSKIKFEQVNYILTALAVADNGFLLSLLIVYLSRFGINLFDNYKFVCKLNVFFGYVFSFLSTWYVVLFSIERLIAVYFPIKRFDICNSNRNKLAVIFLAFVSSTLYSFSFVTSDLELYRNRSMCVTLEKWYELVNYMAFLDIFLTMIIPFLLIAISNVLIVVKLMTFKNPFQKTESYVFKRSFRNDFSSSSNGDHRHQVSLSNDNSRNNVTQSSYFTRNFSIFSYNTNMNSVKRNVSFVILRSSDKKKRKKSYTKTTRLLVIVSTTFLILHTPIAICKIINFVNINSEYDDDNRLSNSSYTTLSDSFNSTVNNISFTSNVTDIVMNDFSIGEIIERFASYIYYLNFSLNFFLYSFNKTKFTKAFSSALSFRSKTERMNSV